ncbi:MAG TPA: hypothetical protein DET40_03345 [Lentisphaeria bacterium]|nr:MAG: hypothetical protein A2X45_22150 [Lentisphaerae bacterium GWF2_50_93]HCE42563.1 hypothetical protein [Lentisphaeria bacterium]
MRIEQLVASPCSCPKTGLEQCLKDFSAIGYRKFELFTEWAESRVDIDSPVAQYLELGRKYGMQFTSMHLPAIAEDLDAGVGRAIKAAKFAGQLGVKAVIYKAKTRELYISGAKKFLDGIEGAGVTAVLQNHKGTPITTIDDYRAVIEGINDKRMKTLLEVGMFHSVGVKWKEGYDLLKGSIALVHIKDQIGEERVPFGEGEVDFKGLFAQLEADKYPGELVVEMEVCRDDYAKTIKLLEDARKLCEKIIKEMK